MSDTGSGRGVMVKEEKRREQHQTQKVPRYPVCGTGLMHVQYLPLEFKLETREGDLRIVDFCMVNLKAIPKSHALLFAGEGQVPCLSGARREFMYVHLCTRKNRWRKDATWCRFSCSNL